MERYKQFTLFLVLVVPALLLFLSDVAFGATVDCTFESSCSGAQVEVLRVGNASTGYNNAHVELNNISTNYDFSLCCSSDANHTLNASCQNATTIPILRAASTNNSHVQTPARSNYEYDICLGSVFGGFNCEYVNSTCSAGYQPVLSMASSGTTNETNAHVGNYSTYVLNVCCSLEDEPPDTPILIYPVDGNTSVFERTVNLTWSVFEPDGDAVTFNVSLNVTPGSCAVEHSLVQGVTDENYTTSELCTDQLYNWSVQACDKDGCSQWASIYNFTIASVLSITFLQNTTSFPDLLPGETNNSEVGPAQAMRIENDGNILADVTINATKPMFTLAPLNNESFRFRIQQNESGSYVSATTTYTNLTEVQQSAIDNLSYVDASDDSLIHYEVTVPNDEPPGVKNSTLIIEVTAS